jgi:predicted PolB exonuclease-like 3'-5' exonuclease
MVWRVSPSPIRLLSQTHDDPMQLWDMNRTEIVERLDDKGYEQIAESYQDYYYEGWLAFLDDFSNSENMRRIISLGFEIIKDCIDEVKKIGI